MKKSTVMLGAIFGTLLMGCSDEEIANVETSSRNAIGFNVLSNAAETRATPTTPDVKQLGEDSNKTCTV